MKRVDELFTVEYGNSLDLASMTQVEKPNEYSVNFVSRTAQNCGVSAIVERISGEKAQNAGTLTVAVGGSVMETFLQEQPYYTGYHVMVLTPKIEMTVQQKLYYCACIRANKYRYNYGRQANKTLKSILIPDINEIPDWVVNSKIEDYSYISDSVENTKIKNDIKYKNFSIDELFHVEYPKTLIYANMQPSNTGINFVSSKAKNNGVVGKVEKQGGIKIYPKGCITVPLKGSVLCSSIQQEDCYVAHQIAVLIPKATISIYAKMYLVTLINANKFRFNYGRQADNTLKTIKLSIPIDTRELPDYVYMEKFIKSLSFSGSL